MLTAYGLSHTGNVRKINEDCWHIDIPLGLFVVADGMGGHNAGEVASTLAVEALVRFMHKTQEGEDVTWPYGIDPGLSYPANRLRTAILLANRRVFRAAEGHEEYNGMGTTVVAASIEDYTLVLGSVGDSRAYSLIDGRLTQLTTDDSWVQTLERSSPVELGDLANHPMRHVLTKVIGAREELDVPIIERPIRVDETLLLCSDGLHGELAETEIAAILGTETGTPQLAEQLIEAVLRRAARDNVTAVVVRRET
jgi:serine/threonine protein phosphatase PrpC